MGTGREDKTGKVAGTRCKVLSVTLKSFYLNPQRVLRHPRGCVYLYEMWSTKNLKYAGGYQIKGIVVRIEKEKENENLRRN